MLIKVAREWEIPEREASSEASYLNRRQLFQSAGTWAGTGLLAAAPGGPYPYPARRNPQFILDRPITPEWAAGSHNNFYEFDQADKSNVKNLVGSFRVTPWTVEVSGLVQKPKNLDLDALVHTIPLEERLYRHRCVEAWSMAVPWTGFPFSELIKMVEPKPEAKYVRFTSVHRPKEMPGQVKYNWYPWPYFEGMRMDEAMNPLCFVVTGLYGKPLPKQNGAPIRIVNPWKYGYKSPKSIVKIEFVAREPETFWHKSAPAEYGFYFNVNPNKPHPRWSQATEKVIPEMERRETLLYNGYEKWVGRMYSGKEA